MFIILPCFACSLVITSIESNESDNIIYILTISLFVLSILSSLSISFIFLYKLLIIYKTAQSNKDDQTLLSLMIKNTILVVISISFSVINLIVVALIPHDNEKLLLAFIRHFMFLFDILTNFMCVTLAFQSFSHHYDIFCGLLDRKCSQCCPQKAIRNSRHKKSVLLDNLCINNAKNVSGGSKIVEPNSEGALQPRSRVTTFIISQHDRNGELSVPAANMNDYQLLQGDNDEINGDIVMTDRQALEHIPNDANNIMMTSDSVYGDIHATNKGI